MNYSFRVDYDLLFVVVPKLLEIQKIRLAGQILHEVHTKLLDLKLKF